MEQEPIAIVGRGCVVPGALDPDTFWENIAASRCHLDPASGGGIVRDFGASFDATGFALDAEEIIRLDPLYQWVLHAARQALREAGHAAARRSDAGLVLGNLSYPSAGLVSFAEQIWRDEPAIAWLRSAQPVLLWACQPISPRAPSASGPVASRWTPPVPQRCTRSSSAATG